MKFLGFIRLHLSLAGFFLVVGVGKEGAPAHSTTNPASLSKPARQPATHSFKHTLTQYYSLSLSL